MDDAESALLAAVRAAPDDDAPRLVYADWLSQRGDPRGERIAIQCELEREDLSDDRYAELRARDAAIEPIAVPDMALDIALPGFVAVGGPAWTRGFSPSQRVSCEADELAARKHDLYRWAPCATELRIWSLDEADTGDLLADPDLVRWGGLADVPLQLAAEVARHAHLDELRSLRFAADEQEDERVLEPLFASGRLPHLESLEIRGMMIDGNLAYLPSIADGDWRRAAFASTLRCFDGEMLGSLDVFPNLADYRAGFYGGSQFVDIAAFSGRLKRLELGPESAQFDPAQPVLAMEPLAEMLRAPSLSQLEYLVFDADRSKPHRPSAWRELDRLPLRALSVTAGIVTHDLVAALIAGPALPQLRALRVHGSNQPTNDAVVALVDSRAWEHLEELDLGPHHRPTAVIAHVLERLPALRRLRCGAQDLPAVFTLDALAKLEILQLVVATNTTAWPEQPLPRMRVIEIDHEPRASRLFRAPIEAWARPRRMQMMPPPSYAPRGDASATVVRFGRDYDAWRRGFLL